MDKFEELKKIISELEVEYDIFNGKYGKINKSAGTRIRKKLQKIKTISQDWRDEIQVLRGIKSKNKNNIVHAKH